MAGEKTTTVNIDVEENGEIDITVLENVAGGLGMPTLTKKPDHSDEWAQHQGNQMLHDQDGGFGGTTKPGDAHAGTSTTILHGTVGGMTVDVTAGAGAHAGAEQTSTGVAAHAGAQAGVTETVGLGHGTTLTETAHAGANASASAGPGGLAVQVSGGAQVSVTIAGPHGLTGNEQIGVHGGVHGSIGLTGADAGAEGQASVTISVGQSEHGSLGHGVTGSQSTTVTIGAYATGSAEAHAGHYTDADGKSHIGVQYGAGGMVGDAITVTETASVSNHNGSLGGSVSVTDPGQLGVKFGGGADYSGGEVHLHVNGAVGFALAGVGGGLDIGINAHPLIQAGQAIEHGATTAAHDVASVATTAGHAIEHGATTAVHDVASVATTAGHAIESTASNVGHAIEHAAKSY